MRIVVIHNRYRSAVPSGENRVVDREAEALAALGHDVVRFERSSDDIEHWSRAKKASLPLRVLWNRDVHRDLTVILRDRRPDVVHVHNTFPLLSAAVLYACRDAAVPVVATIHNRRLVCPRGDFFRDGSVCHDCASGSPVPALVHGCYRGSRMATAPVALAASTQRQAWRSLVAAYLFVSMSLRDQLAALNLTRDRVFVRHHLIPGRNATPAMREPMVFYAGRLDEAKGIRLLMAGWQRYRSMAGGPGLQLVIAGSGPLEPEVRTWASNLPSAEFLGQVSGSRCAELMARARAVIVPSVCEESFGLAAVEAMAAGAAPLAAGHGALPELITPGLDGMLFQPGDPAALAAAVADVERYPARYEDYGDRARQTYEQRFDPQDNLEQLLDIYRFAMAHPVCCPDGRARAARASALAGD